MLSFEGDSSAGSAFGTTATGMGFGTGLGRGLGTFGLAERSHGAGGGRGGCRTEIPPKSSYIFRSGPLDLLLLKRGIN